MEIYLLIFKIFSLYLTIFSTAQSQPKFYLYNKGTDNINLLNDDGTVPSGLTWFSKNQVKVLVHGWNPIPEWNIIEVFKRHCINILAREFGQYDSGYNIILVDWYHIASTPLQKYKEAAQNSKKAGYQIADYLIKLKNAGKFEDWSDIHILGLSMGAHVAGAVGFVIQEKTRGDKIGRITGLDPAGPEYALPDQYWPSDMTRVLDYTDAKFVDIIHTNMGDGTFIETWIGGKAGSNLQAGNIDFYPNGGDQMLFQCTDYQDRVELCSHQMAILFYSLSLREPHKLLSCPCDSYAKFLWAWCPCYYPGAAQPIGELTSPNAHGRHYLTVKDRLNREYFDRDWKNWPRS